LSLAQTLVRSEKEGLVFDDWTTELSAKLVAFEWWWLVCSERKKVARVEGIVSKELKQLTMKFVGAGPCGDIDDSARALAVFSTQRRIIDFEFLNRADRRLKSDRAVREIVQGDAVNDVVDRLLSVACGGDRE
jgi:hypothetical protein